MAARDVQAPSVVLRVKRKREEDPVEALMISKHVKLDPLSAAAAASDQSVFQFAGTVTNEAASEALIMEKVRGHSKLVKLNPLADLSLDDSLQQRREQLKVSRSEHRYKLVAQQRSLPDTTSTSSTSPTKKSSLCILDIEEDIQVEPHPLPPVGQVTPATGHSTKSEITCNNVTMTRDRVGGSQGAVESQFVYDLYYTQDLTTHGMANIDWESVCIRECGVELVHDILDPDDHCYEDDDDDSNDENNWRNDYPDEDDISPTSSHSNSDDDLNDEFRYREAYYDEDSFNGDNGDYYR